MKRNLSSYIITILISAFVTFNSANAVEAEAENAASALLTTYKNELSEIEKYLNSITTLVAPFTQTSSDDGIADGTFYLSRPGKLRWEYNPPTPILIIAKGSLLTYYDSELNQVSHISLDDSLSGFLTRNNISFQSNDITILDISKESGKISITIAQKNNAEEGTLTMKFSEKKISLEGMTVTDAIGKKTSIEFITMVYGKPISKKLFSLPKIKK